MSTMHAQPPLPEGLGFKEAVEVEPGKEIDAYDTNPENEEALLAGTDRWCAFPITTYVPRVRGCWVTVHEPGKDDEKAAEEVAKYWPRGVKPWSVGAWLEDAELGIPEPLEWKL